MTLGQTLRERRQELGKSIEQISAATRIHVRILSALEEDRYADLPARTFTRGFIASYCKALRLDSNQVFQDFHEFLEERFRERQDKDQGHQGYVFEGKELEQNRRGLIILASIAAFFAIAVLLVFKPQNHHRKEKHKEYSTSDQPPETEPAPESDELIDLTASPTAAPSASVATSPVFSSSTTPAPSSTVALTVALAPAASASKTSASPTAAPTLAPTVAPTAAPTVAPTAAPSPTPATSPSPSEKKDPLNKGDDLEPKLVKRKIAFEAVEDAYVKYRVDGRPSTEFNLRKGRFLVLKAQETIRFETTKPEALRYRTKTREYFPLDRARLQVGPAGELLDP